MCRNMVGPEVLGLPKLIDRFQVQGKSSFVILHQNISAAIDSLVICKFTNMGVADEYFARMLSAVIGIQYDTGELTHVGERVWNLERFYNIREGFGKEHDTLPPRLLHEAPISGPSQGWVVQLEPMLKEYYRSLGWDEDGVPKPEKLSALQLAGLMERI